MVLSRQLGLMEQIAHGLLIVAHLWIYYPIARLGEYSPTAAEFLRDAVIFGQVGLIAVWIVLGPRSPTLWVAVPYATAIGAWLLFRGPAAEIDRVLARMLAIEAVAIFAVLGLARQCGLHIARRGALPPFAPQFQYSLRTMFLVTLLLAALAKPLWQFHERMAASNRLSLDAAAFATALPAAATTIVLVWVILCEGRILIRAAAGTIAIATSGATALVLSAREADWWLMTLWLAAQAAVVGGTLAVVRGCDYRLAFQLRVLPFRSLAMWWNTPDRIWSATTWRFVERLK
jgi:hypothetical protein